MSSKLYGRVYKLNRDGTLEATYETLALDSRALGRYKKSLETKAYSFRYGDMSFSARYLPESFFADYNEDRVYLLEIQNGTSLDHADSVCRFYGLMDRKGIGYSLPNRSTNIRCFSLEKLAQLSPNIVPRGVYKTGLLGFGPSGSMADLIERVTVGISLGPEDIWFNSTLSLYMPEDDREEYLRKGVTVHGTLAHSNNGDFPLKVIKTDSGYSSTEEDYPGFPPYVSFSTSYGFSGQASFFPMKHVIQDWSEAWFSDGWDVYIQDKVLARNPKQFNSAKDGEEDDTYKLNTGGALWLFREKPFDPGFYERVGFQIKKAEYVKANNSLSGSGYQYDLVKLTLFSDEEFEYEHGLTPADFPALTGRAAVIVATPVQSENYGKDLTIYGSEIYGTQGDLDSDYELLETMGGLFDLIPFFKHLPKVITGFGYVPPELEGDLDPLDTIPRFPRIYTLSSRPDEALGELQRATGVLVDFVPGPMDEESGLRGVQINVYTREYLAQQEPIDIETPVEWNNQVQGQLPVVVFEGAGPHHRYASGKAYGWYSEDVDGDDNSTNYVSDMPSGEEVITVASNHVPSSNLAFFDGEIRDFFYNDPGLKSRAEALYRQFGRYYRDGGCTLRGSASASIDYVGRVIRDPSQNKTALVLEQETNWQTKTTTLKLYLDTAV